jgi:hypothetical protein
MKVFRRTGEEIAEGPPVPQPTRLSAEGNESDEAPIEFTDEAIRYVNNCLDEGSSADEVVKSLLVHDFTEAEARQLVDMVAEYRRKNGITNLRLAAEGDPAVHERAKRDIMIGGIICVIGCFITCASFAAASGPGGGRYVLAWGAIIFGAIQFFRGLANLGRGG